MKFSFCLLLALLSTGQAFAEPQGPGTSPILTIPLGGSSGGVQFGPRRERDERSWRDRTTELANENDRYQQLSGNTRPCTPIQPGSSNVVANPCPVANRPACSVTFTGISEITYAPERLRGIVLKGQHSAPRGEASDSFDVLDLDGFFTLAALHSTWQSNQLLRGNSAGTTSLPIADILTARTVVAMGLGYQNAMIGRITAPDADPDLAVNLPMLQQKKAFLLSLDQELAKWERSPGAVPVQRIQTALSTGLERFAQTTAEGERLLSQYRDLSVNDRPQVLCNANADSEMVGQVVCSRNFTDGRQRNPSFCPGGISFNNLSSLPVCQIDDGVSGTCRPSLYARSPGTQPGVSAPVVTPQAGAR